MNRPARKPILVSIFIVLICLVVGCTNTPPPTEPAETAVVQATIPPTEKPTQTKTAVPTHTSTPPPTATITPTPTATASPTVTPMPTETAIPATETAIPTVAVTATSVTHTVSPDTAPASPEKPDTLTLADLPNHLGEEATISGQVVAAASFSKGFKFTLDDGTGRADLLLWHNVYDNAWDAPQLNIGATVQATGEVGQYDGIWQIEPNFGGDVTVTTPGGNFAPARPIGELANHVGEMAQINGTILRLESTRSSVKIFVGDETGEIVVFIWRTILDRIPNNVPLGQPGTNVRINGRVENYRSNLELVPSLPYDVEVLP